ncbi:MAG: ribonuclease III domain-containing protein [Methanoregula sp.]|jgi:ribonuclease-3
MDKPDHLSEIEQILGYHFFEREHLIRALTHRAYANEQIQQNTVCMDQEADSTLGDAVLKTGLILFLMEKGFQTKGEITRTKEQLEDNVSLAKVGRRLKIKKFIRLGRGEKDLWRTGEETILADTVEALIGAIFLDSDAGFGVVKQIIGEWFEPELRRVKKEKPVEKKVAPAVSHPKVSSRHGSPMPKKRPWQRSLNR